MTRNAATTHEVEIAIRAIRRPEDPKSGHVATRCVLLTTAQVTLQEISDPAIVARIVPNPASGAVKASRTGGSADKADRKTPYETILRDADGDLWRQTAASMTVQSAVAEAQSDLRRKHGWTPPEYPSKGEPDVLDRFYLNVCASIQREVMAIERSVAVVNGGAAIRCGEPGYRVLEKSRALQVTYMKNGEGLSGGATTSLWPADYLERILTAFPGVRARRRIDIIDGSFITLRPQQARGAKMIEDAFRRLLREHAGFLKTANHQDKIDVIAAIGRILRHETIPQIAESAHERLSLNAAIVRD